MEKNNIKSEILKIGVTGHRIIENEDSIRIKVREVLKGLKGKLPSNHILRVISPLAEGADRIVAEEVLSDNFSQNNQLLAVLPLEIDDYMGDFETFESEKTFKNLINVAREVLIMKETSTREEAYLQVGKYVVEDCDVLIAIWDGKTSRGIGGTAEIVDYAQNINRQVVWINSITGETKKI